MSCDSCQTTINAPPRRRLYGVGVAGTIVAALFATPVAAAESAWVKTGATGRLVYVPDAQGDRILDFSGVGYMGRGVEAIPTQAPTVVTLAPIAGDDTAQIQAAINQVAAMPLGSDGYRGAILLQAGVYDIGTQLNITASGIVLRGEGRGADGTVLHGRGTTQRALVNIVGSTSVSNVGSSRNMIDKVVPAGSNSFRVDVPGEFQPGDKVRITRPGTQAWINAIGMNNPPDGDPPWTTGQATLTFDRVVARIEGNRVFLDAPLPQSFEQQYGGGQIRRYNWNGVVEHVGIENLRGDSDYVSATDENHAWEFITVGSSANTGRAQNVWIKDVTAVHFGYSLVTAKQGSKWVTVDNGQVLDPISVITGGRRYSYDLSGELGLVANSTADKGRHDFVNNTSRTPGPNVFYNSSATNANSDTGPHQRWATGSLFDNVTVQGHDINIRNRGSFGTTHGWAGANMVVWNSRARTFRVQNPPTSQNWLVGSIGPIVEDTTFGPQPSGYYDSHGTPVTVGGRTSLYEAQMNDSRDVRTFHWGGEVGTWDDAQSWSENLAPDAVYRISHRDYLLGDVDEFVYDGSASVDNHFADSAWKAYAHAATGAVATGFDDLTAGRATAFTMQHPLDAGERIVHGYMALAMRAKAGSAAPEFLQLFNNSSANRLEFADLGWNGQINSSSTFVGVVDLGPFVPQMQGGVMNVLVDESAGVDWGLYVATVATPIASPLGPVAVFDAGGMALVTSTPAPLGGLEFVPGVPAALGLVGGAKLHVQGRVDLAWSSTLIFEAAGAIVSEFGAIATAGPATLAGNLELVLAGDYVPAIGDSLALLAASSVTGTFADVTLPALEPGLAWQIDYQPTGVALRVGYAADFNQDGVVDGDDLSLWQANFGTTAAAGDANGDGAVDGGDFLIWQRQRGLTAVASTAASIPEPSTCAAALMQIVCLFARRLLGG
ncbi:MAG: hypothetical protein KF847_07975 [Pirellulales bacterium]|nr:hypothetical protein [Pirellulales bacterium]